MAVEPNNPSEQVAAVSPPEQVSSQPAAAALSETARPAAGPDFFEPSEPRGAAESPEKAPTLPTQDPPAAPPTARPAHSQFVVRMAAQYGLTPEQIAGAPREELEDWVDAQRQRELAYYSQSPQQAPPAPEAEWEPTEEAGYEKPLVELVRGLRSKAKKADELEQRLAAIEQRETQRQRSSVADAIDGAFDSLGAAQQYGSDPGAALAPQGTEMKRRLAVLSIAGIDLNSPPPARVLAKKIREAHEALYGTTPAAPAQQAPAKPTPAKDPATGLFISKEEQARQAEFDELWKRSALAAPTHRNGAAEGTGYEAAVRAVEEYKAGRAGPESGRHRLADEFPK